MTQINTKKCSNRDLFENGQRVQSIIFCTLKSEVPALIAFVTGPLLREWSPNFLSDIHNIYGPRTPPFSFCKEIIVSYWSVTQSYYRATRNERKTMFVLVFACGTQGCANILGLRKNLPDISISSFK